MFVESLATKQAKRLSLQYLPLSVCRLTKNGSFIYHSRGEGTYTPRSPVISSRASSSVPPLGTDYSYEDSEVDIVFPSNELHKRQNDLLDSHSHFQYRHSPAPLKISSPKVRYLVQ